jgi:predicted AlkP superfamily pyrophosphatase or phosphodiesterase
MPLILLSIPGLREKDLAAMPRLREMTAAGQCATLVPSFPCVTCPVQANMTTGRLPAAHGVVANGFYWREKRQVEMWTSPNDCIDRPQIWDLLSHVEGAPTSAVWFAMHSFGAEADYICTPKPKHNPDGSESLWCYTRPDWLYEEHYTAFGHFPLQHFWGPLANIRSTAWIVNSAAGAAQRFPADFFSIYLPHLDYAAQKLGPDSPGAMAAVAELDAEIGGLHAAMQAAYEDHFEGRALDLVWLVAGEYAITPVDHVTYPNRVLREAGLLSVSQTADGEVIDFVESKAWALVDHQFSHVFVANADPTTIEQVAALFRNQPGIAEVLVGHERSRYAVEHARSGEVILVSAPNSWQAYYYWRVDANAPKFARTVDIHRKPGYDPVELHVDMATRSIPLDATLIRGSHGAPAFDPSQQTVLLASKPILLDGKTLADTDVFGIVMKQFGVTMER